MKKLFLIFMMIDFGGLAMHQRLCANDMAAEYLADALMTKTDPEQGDYSLQGLYDGIGYSRALRPPRTG